MSLLFGRKKASPAPSLITDIHSHLLPGLDDGVENFDESITIIKGFKELGYRKLVVTPHVMSDYYRNTVQSIRSKTAELKEILVNQNIEMEIECAAEYYLDEQFMHKLESEEEILSFGDRFVLFETSFLNQPAYLFDAIFKMNTSGYKPVMAHPERYLYIHQNQNLITDIADRGVYFQVNLNSLSGYYSLPAKNVANKLINKGMVNFLGSDCHNRIHLEVLRKSIQTKLYQKALSLDLLNYSV